MTDFFALVLLLVLFAAVLAYARGDLIAWIREEADMIRADSWAPEDEFTSKDARCRVVAEKLDKARARMKRDGIKTLLEGRKAWQTIKPMHDEEPPARVVPFNRRTKWKF